MKWKRQKVKTARGYQEQAAGEEGSNGSMKEIAVGIYSNLKRQLEKSAEEEVSRRRQNENAVSEGSTSRKVQWEVGIIDSNWKRLKREAAGCNRRKTRKY